MTVRVVKLQVLLHPVIGLLNGTPLTVNGTHGLTIMITGIPREELETGKCKNGVN